MYNEDAVRLKHGGQHSGNVFTSVLQTALCLSLELDNNPVNEHKNLVLGCCHRDLITFDITESSASSLHNISFIIFI